MNEQLTRKIIVASGLAVVVGIGAMSVAMRPHAPAAASLALTPPPPVSESPVAPATTAPLPEASAPQAEPPVALAPVAPVVEKPVKPEPRVASPVQRAAVVKPARVTPDLSTAGAAMAAAATANRAETVPAPAVTSMTPGTEALPMLAPTAVVEQKPEVATPLPVSDNEITANVKSEIAVDSVGMSGAIGVTTTGGIVALTGSLSSQDDIDHIKGVVARVKDVKSVDTTAMSVSAT